MHVGGSDDRGSIKWTGQLCKLLVYRVWYQLDKGYHSYSDQRILRRSGFGDTTHIVNGGLLPLGDLLTSEFESNINCNPRAIGSTEGGPQGCMNSRGSKGQR